MKEKRRKVKVRLKKCWNESVERKLAKYKNVGKNLSKMNDGQCS